MNHNSLPGFVLLVDAEACVFISDYHHRVIGEFNAARVETTWGEFLSAMSADVRQFIDPYLPSSLDSKETDPEDDDLLEELEAVWMLEDSMFPWIQCFADTTDRYGHLFPKRFRNYQINTEFGMPVDVYPFTEIHSILKDLWDKSIDVRVEKSLFRFA